MCDIDLSLRTSITELCLVCMLTLTLAGCSTITTTAPDGTVTTRDIDGFRHYVEDVFRRQNRIGDLLIEFETADYTANESHISAVVLAEERMHEACQSLNAAALAVAEGRNVELGLSMRIVDSVARCEHAARELEMNLKRLSEDPFAATTIPL
jgi:hypothetical protein